MNFYGECWIDQQSKFLRCFEARQEGKVAYIIMDKIMHAHRKDENQRDRPNTDEPPDTELSEDENFTYVEDEVSVKNACQRR